MHGVCLRACMKSAKAKVRVCLRVWEGGRQMEGVVFQLNEERESDGDWRY